MINAITVFIIVTAFSLSCAIFNVGKEIVVTSILGRVPRASARTRGFRAQSSSYKPFASLSRFLSFPFPIGHCLTPATCDACVYIHFYASFLPARFPRPFSHTFTARRDYDSRNIGSNTVLGFNRSLNDR